MICSANEFVEIEDVKIFCCAVDIRGWRYEQVNVIREAFLPRTYTTVQIMQRIFETLLSPIVEAVNRCENVAILEEHIEFVLRVDKAF